jgi:hypothetical protein
MSLPHPSPYVLSFHWGRRGGGRERGGGEGGMGGGRRRGEEVQGFIRPQLYANPQPFFAPDEIRLYHFCCSEASSSLPSCSPINALVGGYNSLVDEFLAKLKPLADGKTLVPMAAHVSEFVFIADSKVR